MAKKIDKISYDEMLELSSGAKVMQSSAVQTAMIYNIPLNVKSTFTNREGTNILNNEEIDYTKAVTGVAYSNDDAKITLAMSRISQELLQIYLNHFKKIRLILIWLFKVFLQTEKRQM